MPPFARSVRPWPEPVNIQATCTSIRPAFFMLTLRRRGLQRSRMAQKPSTIYGLLPKRKSQTNLAEVEDKRCQLFEP